MRARHLPFAVVIAVSLVVLFAPGSDVPSGLPISDKLVHGTLFAALALTGWYAGIRGAWLLPVLATYAVVSEILQAVLPIHRDGDWHDTLADVCGAVVGLVIGFTIARSGRTTSR